MRIIPESFADYNIYCTSADGGRDAVAPVPETTFLRELKTSTILGKHIYISAGHIFNAEHTRLVLTRYPEFLESGTVAVGLREDCRDFQDLYALRADARRSGDKSEKNLADWLDTHTAAMMRWHPSGEQPLFRSSLLHSLENPRSLLRRRLTGTKKANIQELAKAIEDLDTDQITRTQLRECAMKHIPKRVRAFILEVNALYYTIGAYDKQLVPHYSPLLFSDVVEGVISSTTRQLHSRRSGDMFSGVTKALLFPDNILDDLPVANLIVFRNRNAALLRGFRNKWWDAVGESEVNGHVDSSEIVQHLADIARQELRRANRYDTVSQTVAVTSLGVSAASLVPEPTIAGLSFLISTLSYALSRESARRRLIDTRFLSLCTALRHEICSQQGSAPPPKTARRSGRSEH